jgi:hypothetical protein
MGESVVTLHGIAVTDLASVISTLFAAIATLFSFLQIQKNTIQMKHQQQAERARVFMEITDRWSKIYPIRNHALAAPVVSKEDLLKNYGRDYKAYLDSQEWKDLRGVCNFFEFLGVVLHQKFITPGELFVLVTVDVFKQEAAGHVEQVPDGVMYSRLKGPISYLREVYRPDIYVFYDQYLLVRYKNHRPLVP